MLERVLNALLDLDPVSCVLGIPRRHLDRSARSVALGELDLARACAATAAAPVQRRICGDAVEKRRETRLAPEAVAVSVKAEEGLLSRVLGLFPAAEHPVEQAKDVALVGANEPLEGARIAGLPAPD